MIQMTDGRVLKSYRKQEKDFFTDSPSFVKVGDRRIFAYVEVMENCERLMVQEFDAEPQELFRAKYISAPVITENGVLFSAYESKLAWYACAADWKTGKVYAISEKSGKRDFFSAAPSGDYVVYGKREGIHTKICITRFADGVWQPEQELTDGINNAYDPAIAVNNGIVYVIYTCFVGGNYHIYLQQLDEKQNPLGKAARISDQKASCAWPSVYPRKEGGVWVCWSSFSRDKEFEVPYVQHLRHRMQSKLFTDHTEIYAGVYEGGKLFYNLYEERNSNTNEPFRVEHAETSKSPKIFEKDGEVYILLRHYSGENINLSDPDVSITTLTSFGWKEPQILVQHGLHEAAPSFQVTKDGLELLTGRDNRRTGWCMKGEYFDLENTVDLVHLSISLEKPEKEHRCRELCRYYVGFAPIPSMEEPEYPAEPGRKYQLIWGQTHTHTNLSVCQRLVDQTLDFNYRFYQDVQKSRFGALSDHGYNMWPSEVYRMHKKADYYYFPGEFIALPCYEWTGSDGTDNWGGPYGHVNPVFCEEEGRMHVHVATDPDDCGHTLRGLWKQYAGRKIVTIPHHTADRAHPYTWDNYNETFVPIVEIFQDCRGQCEQEGILLGTTAYTNTSRPGCWVLDGLKRGYRLGFIGGGDHAGIGRGGAEVTELTREALYDAFMNRRCYASTGAGADLNFTANGQPVGSVIEGKTCHFRFSVHTAEEIRVVEFVKNGETIDRFYNLGKSFVYEFDTKKEKTKNFYYFRIGQANGEVFWTSPIWH